MTEEKPTAGKGRPDLNDPAKLGPMVRVLRRDLDQLGDKVDANQLALTERLGEVHGEVTALATGVDGLKRGFVKLTTTVEQLVDDMAAEEEKPPPPIPFSWFTCTDRELAAEKLANLEEWLIAVYLQFPKGGIKEVALPECWRRHSWVIEELLVLMESWVTAYLPGASPNLRSDWHNRWRPEVVKRLADKDFQECGFAKHPHTTENPADFKPVELVGVEDKPAVVSWWTATHGQRPEPAPSTAALAESRARAKARATADD
jgi:hypothetical protein